MIKLIGPWKNQELTSKYLSSPSLVELSWTPTNSSNLTESTNKLKSFISQTTNYRISEKFMGSMTIYIGLEDCLMGWRRRLRRCLKMKWNKVCQKLSKLISSIKKKFWKLWRTFLHFGRKWRCSMVSGSQQISKLMQYWAS